MHQTEHNVFISYARADLDWVSAMVNLLKAGGAKVFMDIRDIAYGDDWRQVLVEKLGAVERVLVFWSTNAAGSQWVEEEFTIAIRNGKRVVPVPIDDTPLPVSLARFHALTDLKPILQQSLAANPVPVPPAAPGANKGSPALRVWAVAALATLVIGPAIFFLTQSEIPVPADSGPLGVPIETGQTVGVPGRWFLLATLLLGVLAVGVTRWLKRRAERARVREVFRRYLPPHLPEAATVGASPVDVDVTLGRRVVELVFREPGLK